MEIHVPSNVHPLHFVTSQDIDEAVSDVLEDLGLADATGTVGNDLVPRKEQAEVVALFGGGHTSFAEFCNCILHVVELTAKNPRSVPPVHALWFFKGLMAYVIHRRRERHCCDEMYDSATDDVAMRHTGDGRVGDTFNTWLCYRPIRYCPFCGTKLTKLRHFPPH